MSHRVQGAVKFGLNHLYGAAANYSERPDVGESSKRKFAAGTAASLLGAGIDRFNKTHPSDSFGDEESFFDDLGEQNHFTDILLEKLLVHALPDSIPQKEEFQKRLNDPLRNSTERFSIPKFTSNLRKVTTKIGGLFQTEYFVLRIFTWTQPSLTLTALVIYTLIVLHPNTLFILPLVFLLYIIMVPGYVYRHPIHKPKLLKVRDRGDSLLDNFTRVEDAKQLELLIEQDELEKEMIENRVPEIEVTDNNGSRLLKKNMEFFLNLRDLQNSMTKALKILDDLENFWYGTAGFRDERVSTSMFFSVFFAAIGLVGIGRYIPWRFLLIVSVWGSLIMLHANMRPKVKKLNERLKPQKKEIDKIVKESERADILIDDPPEIKEIEIFEIWKKSITSSQWEFYMFSSKIFDETDFFRKAQKPPPGVLNIEKVQPPKTWRFDDESWNIDYDCKEWYFNRGLKLVGSDYIDKNNEFHVDEAFKRRRLYRSVIRYSKPARKPAHLL